MCHTGMTELCPLGTIGALKGTLGPLSKEQQLAIKSKQARASSSALRHVDSGTRHWGARALIYQAGDAFQINAQWDELGTSCTNVSAQFKSSEIAVLL